jgi:hypothetical protein
MNVGPVLAQPGEHLSAYIGEANPPALGARIITTSANSVLFYLCFPGAARLFLPSRSYAAAHCDLK